MSSPTTGNTGFSPLSLTNRRPDNASLSSFSSDSTDLRRISTSAAAANTSESFHALQHIPEYLRALTTFPAHQLNCSPTSSLLPSQLNAKDKCGLVSLSPDGLTASYVGSGKNDSDAASVRSNRPIPPQCGIYYFEMQVVSKGRDGYIGIGICGAEVRLTRLPGWDKDSWGYHGDDGHIFASSGTGRAYGPKFTTGDVIGCVVNFWQNVIFFTKNGVALGPAFNDILGKGGATTAPAVNQSGYNGLLLFPCVGFRTPGEQAVMNFGQSPFCFDIFNYVQGEKNKLWSTILENPLPPLLSSSASQGGSTKQGVRQCGLMWSLAPAKECTEDAADSPDQLHPVLNQLVLGYLIHHGYRQSAKALAASLFPGMSWKQIIQQRQLGNENVENMDEDKDDDDYDDDDDDDDVTKRQRIYDLAVAGDIDGAIELTQTHYPSVLNHADLLFRLQCRKFVEMIRSECHNEAGLLATMDYGRKLHAQYGSDPRKEVVNALYEAFALVAYPDPFDSIMAPVLDPIRREPLADALNSAILETMGQPTMSGLETCYRQTTTILRELQTQGNAIAALVDLERDVVWEEVVVVEEEEE